MNLMDLYEGYLIVIIKISKFLFISCFKLLIIVLFRLYYWNVVVKNLCLYVISDIWLVIKIMKCKMDIGIILFVFGIKLKVKLIMIIK